MRAAVLSGFLVLLSIGAAQVPEHSQQPAKPISDNPVILRVDAQPQKTASSPFVEYLTAVSDLVRAVVWPLLRGVLVIVQRRPLARLLEALVELISHSNHIKLGDMIDVEVDRSAKQAENRDASRVESTHEEIEAATRVGRIAESADSSEIRVRMVEFAREYEATRSNMKPGPDRTRAMNAIVAKMRTLGIAALPLLREFAHDKNSPGRRLAALAILQLSPDLAYVDWLVERMAVEQPFVFFHASHALLAMVRSYGIRARNQLEGAIARSLEIVGSFAGGRPDRNTVETLQLAQDELIGQTQIYPNAVSDNARP